MRIEFAFAVEYAYNRPQLKRLDRAAKVQRAESRRIISAQRGNFLESFRASAEILKSLTFFDFRAGKAAQSHIIKKPNFRSAFRF